MSARDNGGPAFPVAADGAYIADCENPNAMPAREFPGHPGMTLRDWFAGQALAAIIANESQRVHMAEPMYDPDDPADIERMRLDDEAMKAVEGDRHPAVLAYQMADAMIAERDKP